MGLIVLVEAQHLCLSMRGVKKRGCIVKTTIIKGCLKNDKNLLDLFYRELEVSSVREGRE
ncbi:MAG: GTP cyclohydrolase 1 [Candidatus Woesebacteria bacterium GW2011_GWA1_39_21]|uniref:GTP cyclohydrolase 1 n=1 Tax=Candidatus Woesebacteria bacterium GW2011_GWA1_39_21 TaxID=1618550 RepID=A0A0G0N4E5_9BACT|nr:MAG: GTP cyclohydrolase 1 [Candidatus Woesebacteria bacterium GW2011_GWA1_39_21]